MIKYLSPAGNSLSFTFDVYTSESSSYASQMYTLNCAWSAVRSQIRAASVRGWRLILDEYECQPQLKQYSAPLSSHRSNLLKVASSWRHTALSGG